MESDKIEILVALEFSTIASIRAHAEKANISFDEMVEVILTRRMEKERLK